MYSWVGWRCHNPLAAKGERERSLGQRGEEYMRQLLCSTHAGEWAWTCNVTAVNIVFRGSVLFWRKRGKRIHAPPRSGLQVKEKNGRIPKMNPLPLRKLIYGGPLDESWHQLQHLYDWRMLPAACSTQPEVQTSWNDGTCANRCLKMLFLLWCSCVTHQRHREKSSNWKCKVQMQFLSTTGCSVIDSCSLRIGQRILDAESKYGRRSSANDAAMTRWQPQHPCGNITLKRVIHFPRCYNKQYTVATQCFILKEEHLDTRSKRYVAVHLEKIIPPYRRGPELRGFVTVTEVTDKSHACVGEQKQLPQEVVARTLESHKKKLVAHEEIELEFAGGLTIYHHHPHVINSLQQQTSLFMPFKPSNVYM